MTPQCEIASALVLNSIPILSLIGTPSFISKKNFCIGNLSNRFNEDHERDATTTGNGFPTFRALARMAVIERFSETAMLTADEPSSISTIRCAV
jgi:hypothetical protein